MVRAVDRSTLVPDDSLTIDQGAVAPWNSLMWSLMTDVCRAMGVRTDVPFRDLTDREKEIVYDGPAVKKHILYHAKNSNDVAELDFTYYSAVRTVENALSKVKDEKGMKRVEKFLKEDVCPDCGGTRLSEAARAPRLRGIGLDEACRLALGGLGDWGGGGPGPPPPGLPRADLYAAGLSGRPDSGARRLALLRRLELPEHLTANGLLAVLNACYGAGEAEEILFSEAPAAAGREAEEKKEKIFPKTP